MAVYAEGINSTCDPRKAKTLSFIVAGLVGSGNEAAAWAISVFSIDDVDHQFVSEFFVWLLCGL